MRPIAPLRLPLIRLLAINLAAGIGVALLLLGGLLALNPFRLRDLALADHSPGAAIGLLLFGFVITFGSMAMGTAIMMLGAKSKGGHGGRRVPAQATSAPQPARNRSANSTMVLR